MTSKEIQVALLKDIRCGVFADFGKIPSESELCRKYRVARNTVRAALEELRRQGLIEKRMGAGSFLTRRASRRTGLVGLVIPDYSGYGFFEVIYRELERHVKLLGYRVELVTTREREPAKAIVEIRRRCRELAVARAEGVIFRPFISPKATRFSREVVEIFKHAETPLVLLDSDVTMPPERSNSDLVAVNNIDAGRRVAEHLVKGGFRHIAFLSGERGVALNFNWNNRLFGLAGELAVRGIEGGVKMLRFSPDNVKALERALQGDSPVDAIVCGNDESAALLMSSLKTLDCRVPDEVAVVGFDDLDCARAAVPSLTTVSQPVKELAVTAFKVLLARVRYPNNDPREIYLPAPLVVRRSTEKY